MKKIGVFLMTAILALGALSGCGKNNVNDGSTIRVAAFKGAYGEEFWKDIKVSFEEAYKDEGYKIEYEAKQNIEDTINPQINAGNGPDVIYLPVGQEKALTEKLIKSKTSILAIDDVLDMTVRGEDKKVKEKIMPGFLDNNQIRPYRDNKVYMLPLFYSPLGLYYNKNLFNEDGSEGKYKIPKSWNDIDELKVKLDEENQGKGDNEKRYLFAYGNSGYMKEFIFSAVAAKSGTDKLNELFGYEESYTGSAEFKEVLTKVSELRGYVYPGSWDIAKNYKENQETLLLNRSLLLPCGTWLPTEMEDKQKADNFEYAFTSNFAFEEGGDRYAHAKIEQVYILNQSRNKNIAKEFVSYLFSDKVASIIAEKAKALTPTVNALNIAKTNNYINKDILSYYDIYSTGAKLCVGDFFQANVRGINWRDVFTGNVNEILKNSSYTVEEWQKEIKTKGAQLKNTIR